jgi:hypothetical protein
MIKKCFQLSTVSNTISSSVVFLLLCTNAALAQTTQTKLDQVKLMKQFLGTWKCEYAKDTTRFWDVKSFGTGFECYLKVVTKGKVVMEAKRLWGYDKRIDKYYATTLPKGMDIYIDVYCFISKNKCKIFSLYDIENPDKAPVRWEIEFKSPDMFTETYISNNEPFKIRTFTRIK